MFRGLFVFLMGLMPQDAYYTFYSEHLSLSYYDHPPMIAYLLYVFIFFFGKSAMTIKLATWSVGLGTLLLVYGLSRRFFSQNTSMRNLAILSSTVMMSILTLVATPDVPLLFFWTASVIAIYEAIFKERKAYWMYAGILMGLTFDSKYTGILLPMCMFFFLLLSGEKRRWLRSPWPYLSLLVMMIVMAPVIYWNYQNDFASFFYQSTSRASVMAEDHWKPEHILGSIAMQATVLVPVLFVFLFLSLYQYLARWRWKILDKTEDLFLLSFFVPVFGGFMFLSFFYWVKLNWMMPAYVTGILFLAPRMSKSWFSAQCLTSMVLHLALAIEVFGYVIPVQSDDTWFGWPELADKVEILSTQYPDAFIVGADHYKTTAELMFYMDRKVYGGNVFGKRAVHFDYIGDDLTLLNGRNALIIDSDPRFTDTLRGRQIPHFIQDRFDSIEELEPIILYRRGDPVRKFSVFLAREYSWGRYEPELEDK